MCKIITNTEIFFLDRGVVQYWGSDKAFRLFDYESYAYTSLWWDQTMIEDFIPLSQFYNFPITLTNLFKALVMQLNTSAYVPALGCYGINR